jgi:hypothetical protein
VARLVAIAHAILCVPSSWNVDIFCVQGAIDAISWFKMAATDRHRLRLCGSPVLSFICAAILARKAAGGSTSFVAYRDSQYAAGAELERAGKCMASVCAADSAAVVTSPSCVLPAQAIGSFVSCSVEARAPKRIMGGIRKHVTKLDKDDVARRWSMSQSQAQFASPAAEPFVTKLRQMVAHGDIRHRHFAFALRLLSDSIQFAIIGAPDLDRKFVSQTCNYCDGKREVNVDHLFSCSGALAIDRRRLVTHRLLGLLDKFDGARSWVEAFKRAEFVSVIQNLFSTWHANFVVDRARCIRSAFGCFSETEFAEAMRNLHIGSVDHPWMENEVRRLLVTFAYDEWACRMP